MKMKMNVAALLLSLLIAGVAPATAQTGTEKSGKTVQRMSLDVKETDIEDVIRMISKGYDLNIILDKDVTGKVTLHLINVPIMEGLESLAESHGLEVVKDGSVFRIRKATQERRMTIRSRMGLLTADVQNADVLEFIKEVSSKTGASIVPDSRLSGKVSGKLYEVPLDDGLRALLEANGFKVLKRRNIYRVASSDASKSESGAARMSRRGRRSLSKGDLYIDFQNGLLSVDVMGANLSDVIESIAEQSEIEIVTYGVISDVVNAKLNDMPLTEAFALLLGGTKFTFIKKENVLLIGDRNTATPSGNALSTSELIHLRHIKADDVPKILPKNIPAANVKVVKEQNALLISGTSEDIVKTREFLTKIDIPTPQVVINVIVVEYSRDMGRKLGIEFGNDPSGKIGSNGYSFPYTEYNRKGASARSLLKIPAPQFAQSIIDRLPDNFYVTVRALEEEGRAKVLAQPSITVLNGNKASINVGQTQYFRIVAGTSDNPTYRFQPITFGIKLDITPWISQGGQITAVINPEISNAMGVNAEGYPNVFTRSVSTTVRLEDGHTLILGGLLRSEDQVTHKQVPILSKIPLLGNLFKTTDRQKIQTNLALYITPTIVDLGSYVNIDEELSKMEEKEKQGFKEDLFDELKDRNGNPSKEDSRTISDTPTENDGVLEDGSESDDSSQAKEPEDSNYSQSAMETAKQTGSTPE